MTKRLKASVSPSVTRRIRKNASLEAPAPSRLAMRTAIPIPRTLPAPRAKKTRIIGTNNFPKRKALFSKVLLRHRRIALYTKYIHHGGE